MPPKRRGTPPLAYHMLRQKSPPPIIDMERSELKFNGTKIYKEEPAYCSLCGCSDIIGIELLGTNDGILFWQCELCDSRMLKYSLKRTKEWLHNAPRIDIEERDWHKAWAGLPN